MLVYIICILDSHNNLVRVGAAYNSEEKASEEIKRLTDANPFTRAYYVTRYLGES